MLALHACALAACVMGPESASTIEYFDEASHWEAGSKAGSDAYWEQRGFLSYASQRHDLDFVRHLLAGQDLGEQQAWSILLQAWKDELQQRYACLVNIWAEHQTGSRPEPLIFDALHLFCNRLGLNLDVECYLYYLIGGALRNY